MSSTTTTSIATSSHPAQESSSPTSPTNRDPSWLLALAIVVTLCILAFVIYLFLWYWRVSEERELRRQRSRGLAAGREGRHTSQLDRLSPTRCPSRSRGSDSQHDQEIGFGSHGSSVTTLVHNA
ncbi:hypothetical protein F5Y16DRAFT_399998 [Xylariaceae sp. FL0255]|nr:hypothetical protein F5Y16DRAFT_399998 [Xylariaceae sp. FL0255]